MDKLIKEMNVNLETGLTIEEVKERQKKGINELEAKKRKPLIVRFLEEFKDVLIIILLVAALLSVIIDPEELIESIIILIVVILNAVLGVYQESKAEKSLEALKKLSSPLAKVLRDGRLMQVESKEVVVGDVLFVEAGDYIVADAIIIEQNNLKVDESSLTGESVAVEKTSEEIGEVKALGDMRNRLFSSTYVTYGKARAIVIKIGMETEIGKIASLLNKHREEPTPLQIKLNQIGKVIGIFAIIICAVVFLLEWLAVGMPAIDAFQTSVALAVAAIPEGLATVVVVVLAVGVEKMARQKAIVKKLPAVETLGSTSVVCSDKTGTLTQNKMTVVKVYKTKIRDYEEDLSDDEKELLTFFALCSDAKITIENGTEKRIGDPTETALIAANNQKGLYRDLDKKFKRLADLPFDSERKMMSVIVSYQGSILSITKGAPDIIISKSKNINRTLESENNDKMASKALRVLALAVKKYEEMPKTIDSETLENDLDFVGMVGMIDPARKEVKEAIKVAKKAGIRTVMITGDHVATAKAIALELGILHPGEEAITSKELSNLTDDELFKLVEKYSVYARANPEDKVRIVKAWQRRGKVVAMTGDGVNDSPALKIADIGCAMGITGTDVAKEASSMILVDDNFATIILAVEEGRNIYRNIKKTVQYLLASNFGEVVTIFIASILSAFILTKTNFGIPFLPIHLLWINLITDSFPAFALGLEKAEDDLMKMNPRPKHESFFAHNLGFTIAFQGIIIGLISLVAYSIGIYQSNSQIIAQTMAFLTLSMIQLFHAFNIKSRKSVFHHQVFNNKYLWMAFILGFSLQIAIIYIPLFARIFKVSPLNIKNFSICFGLAFLIVVIMEIVKMFQRRLKIKN